MIFLKDLRVLCSIVFNYIFDFFKYVKNSSTFNQYKNQFTLEGRIILFYHAIEKGLSLKNTRIGFGSDRVAILIKLLYSYEKKYEINDTFVVSLNVLYEYYYFNKENGNDNKELYEHLVKLKKLVPSNTLFENRGGTKKVTKKQIVDATKIDFENFTNNRFSIRNFSEENIDISLIKNAINIAVKTPSVCNRQPWRAHIFSEEESKRKLLSYQNGNGGFGQDANYIILVTTDINYFYGQNERNQAFIDGGMFSMSLVYALHSLGLATCCLNCSIGYKTEKKLRAVSGISDSESIIMMIAVGAIPEELSVAYSDRKSVEEIANIR